VRHLDDASRGMRRVIEPVKKGRLSLWPFSRKQDQTTLQDDFAAADSEHEDILAEPRQLLQHDAVKAAFENPATVSAMMQALWSQGRGAEMLKMFQQAQDRVAKVSAYNKILADPAARMALAWFKRQEAKFWDSGTPVPLLVLQYILFTKLYMRLTHCSDMLMAWIGSQIGICESWILLTDPERSCAKAFERLTIQSRRPTFIRCTAVFLAEQRNMSPYTLRLRQQQTQSCRLI